MVCWGKAHCGLGSAQPLSASARFTVVAKSSMPIMVPRNGSRPLLAVLAYVPCGQPRRAGLVALSLHGDDSCVGFGCCCGVRALRPVFPS